MQAERDTPPHASLSVGIYGSGAIGTRVGTLLTKSAHIDVRGPFDRDDRSRALQSGADVVVIATASFLAAVAGDVLEAIEAGSNVITTAEEAAYPMATDTSLARDIDELARARNVTVLGAGVNPGLAFDALILTLCGAMETVESVRISRTVDLSGWGVSVLRQLGVGWTSDAFRRAVAQRRITGHVGWLESASLVANQLGVPISRTQEHLEAIPAKSDIATQAITITAGESAGFRQHFVAHTSDRPWYSAEFVGHVDLSAEGLNQENRIELGGKEPIRASIDGFSPQSSTAAVIANSISRVVSASAGWLTVADLPPASPSR